MSRGLWTLATCVCLVVSGCDSGPSGPGTFTASLGGPSLGGVVLEVQGRGIQAFTARGASRVYSAAVDGRPDTHRVIVITPDPGEMSIEMAVADVGMEGPTVTVISAANAANQTISVSTVTVRLEG